MLTVKILCSQSLTALIRRTFPLTAGRVNNQAIISALAVTIMIGMEFGEGDATKQKSVKKSALSLTVGTAVNEVFGQEFYRKGHPVKRLRPCGELPDPEHWVFCARDLAPWLASYRMGNQPRTKSGRRNGRQPFSGGGGVPKWPKNGRANGRTAEIW